jgi:S-adenosylmethionine:diacylglycerol 3-amino-3-carboxypropyl transferase/phosphohistidine swiveling domain-containing protein
MKELRSQVASAKFFRKLGYSTCWEDPEVLRQALMVNSEDNVLSITSAGDLSIGLLLEDPRHIISIDLNPIQNHLLELKLACFKALDYREMLSFLGVRPSERRLRLYPNLRPHLSPAARRFWSDHPRLLEGGVLHQGKQDRYFFQFGKILRCLLGVKKIDSFLHLQDLPTQHRFFEKEWDGFRWRSFFDLFFSRRVMSLYMDAAHFNLVKHKRFGPLIRKQADRILKDSPVWENYFVHWVLTQSYPGGRCMPPYLQEDNFETIGRRADRITVVTEEIETFLGKQGSGSVSKFNFSNMFDWIDDKVFRALLGEIARVAGPNARMCYYNFLHWQIVSDTRKVFKRHPNRAENLLRQNRAMGYTNFELYDINPLPSNREGEERERPVITQLEDKSLGKKPIFFGTEPAAPDPRQVGHKALNLWRLARAGLHVPRWFVITQDVFISLLAHHHIDIEALIEDRGASGVRQRFEKGLLAAGRRALNLLIEENVDRYFSDVRFFSIRSSGIDEDSRETSFAGILDSYLFVRREDLLECIVRCAGSAFSARATAYLNARGFPQSYIRTAVIIQEMVHSEKSGVLFTRDPVSQADACVVTAGFGVGEGVVANRVETDTMWLDHDTGDFIEARTGVKASKMTAPGDSQKGPVLSSIPETTAPVLNRDEMGSLFRMMKTVEGIYADPQDIEWAFDARGLLHLLQTRPITSLNGHANDIIVWDNSNIVESYPGVTTPLTYSFVRHVYERVMKGAATGLMLGRKIIEENSGTFETLIGYIDGRIYYNLTNWYRMVSLSPILAKDKTACNRMLGIKGKGKENGGETRASYLSLVALLWKFCFRHHYRRRFYREFDKLYSEFVSIDFDSSPPNELYAIFKKLEAGLVKIWPTTIENDFFVMLSYELLTRFLRKAGLADQVVSFQKQAYRRQAEMESMKPVRSLANLARTIRGDPRLVRLFALDDQEILQRLQETRAFRDIHKAIQAYIDNYGDRTLHELKLETKSMGDDPTILVRLLRRALSQKAAYRRQTQVGEEDSHWEKTIGWGICKNPFRRLILHLLIKHTREGITHRENMRFARTRAYGLVKKIFRGIGRSFCDLGLLDSTEDIFFLAMEEIFAVLNGSAVNLDLRPTVQLRRERFRLQEQSPTPPSRLFTQGPAAIAPRLSNLRAETSGAEGDSELRGIGGSPGSVTAHARILRKPEPGLNVEGKILVAEMTDPGWVFLMIGAQGIIVERGSVLSHTAIIGRELGIPTIVGLPQATESIKDGELITMDGSTGVVTRLNEERKSETQTPNRVFDFRPQPLVNENGIRRSGSK